MKAKRTLVSPRTFVLLCPDESLNPPNTSSIRFVTPISPTETEAETLAFYGRPYGRSLCHAWSSAPVALLPMIAFGCEPAAVLRDYVGYSDKEIAALAEAGVIDLADAPAFAGA